MDKKHKIRFPRPGVTWNGTVKVQYDVGKDKDGKDEEFPAKGVTVQGVETWNVYKWSKVKPVRLVDERDLDCILKAGPFSVVGKPKAAVKAKEK